MSHRCTGFALLVALALLAGCATASHSRETALTETLRSYAATIRWGDLTQAQAFVEPAYRDAHPLSRLDAERYRQVQVSYYRDSGTPVMVSETEATQNVEIGLININTQAARAIVDRQTWKYDPVAKHWWLTSGMPDITRTEQ